MTTKATRDVLDLSTRPVQNAVITGGTIDGTAIGATTASTGRFSNLNATANLTAAGNIDFSGATLVGSLRAKYGDLAEEFRADAEYAPGTVVVLGGEFEITQSQGYMAHGVFGVIATDPAFVINAGGAPPEAIMLPVALVGRVPVRVTGRVAKGDRLVSSEVPGVAKAVRDYELPSCSCSPVIGRALADKANDGLGLVEIVVSTTR